VSIAETAPLGVNVINVFNEGNAFGMVERYGLHVVASAEELAEVITEAGSALDEPPDDGSTDAEAATGPATLSGTGEFEAMVDDHGGDRATATALAGEAVGRIETVGDVDVFTITVDQMGTLAIFSVGPTDLTGRLETAEGEAVAIDDDDGAWYNFSLEGAVAPGTYLLRVSHCCDGTGNYAVSASFTPN